MRISMEADYALRIIYYLSLNDNIRYEAREIANKLNITIGFVKKILNKLNRAGLTVATRGRNGGYSLGINKKAINMRSVIETIDGPIILNLCLKTGGNCSRGDMSACPMHKQLYDLKKIVYERLDNATFEKLIT